MGFYQLNGRTTLLRQIDNFTFVDPKKTLANYSTQLLLGKGIEFKSENEEWHKIWHEFSYRNRVFELMWQAELMSSFLGVAFITINIDRGGKVYWNIANPEYTNTIGRNMATEQIAVLYERFQTKNSIYIIQSIYDTQKVRRFIWDNQNRVDVNAFNSEVDTEDQIVEEWYHNLGFVPVFTITNKPFRPWIINYNTGWFGNNMLQTSREKDSINRNEASVCDTANASGMPEIINNLYRQYYKEMIYAKSRVIANDVQSYTANTLADQDEQFQLQNADFFIRLQGGPQVSVQQNSNKLGDYQMAINQAWEDFYNRCGYSLKASTANQKSTDESQSQFSNSIETTNFKRMFHTEQWIRGLVKTFSVYKIDLLAERESWSFEIKKNIITDENSMRDNLIKEIQVGTKTPVDMISQLQGIDRDYAENIWNNNLEWFKENDFPITMKDGGGGVSGVKGASLPNAQNGKGGDKDKGGREPKNATV